MEDTGTGATSEEDTESLRQCERRDKGRVANTNTAGNKSRRSKSMTSWEGRSTRALTLIGESTSRFYRINHGVGANGSN